MPLAAAHPPSQSTALPVDEEHLRQHLERFLTTLAHELRNPLSPIVAATQLMRLRAPDVFDRERAMIERSATHLVRLVDDLLDVAKLAHGRLTLARSPTDLSEVVGLALELVTASIEERGHRLHVSVSPHVFVDVDRVRMAQVIAKLVGNAAKFTRRGGAIEILSRETEDRVELEVVDNGAGIAPGVLPHVFELFVQGAPDPELERRNGGLGVGLALARALVELHGGTIRAHSDGPGAGSRFAISLARCPRPAPPEGAALRVLVVDDNEDAACLLAEALRLGGHEVAVCHDGLAAVRVAHEFQPSIAFLDIGLPGLDGYELCRALRAMARPLTIAAVTGYGQPSDRERAHAAGFDLHYVKPVSLREVQQAIERCTRDATPGDHG